MKLKTLRTVAYIVVCFCVILSFQNCGSSAGPTGTSKSSQDTDNGSFDFDSTGPEVVLLSKPGAFTRPGFSHFEVTGNDFGGIGVDRLEYRLNNATTWTIFKGVLDFPDLAAGDHKISFRAYDLKGNLGQEKMYLWSIDTVAPTASFSSKPAAQTTSTSAHFVLTTSDSGGQVIINSCKINNQPVSDCDADVTLNNLAVGFYTFEVEVQDVAGNKATAEHTWMVTNAAGDLPVPQFEVAPAAYVTTNSVTLKIRDVPGTGYTLSCKLDGVDRPCQLGQAMTINVTEKITNGTLVPYVFTATLKKGTKTATATREWRVDVRAPTITLVNEVSGVLTVNDIVVYFRARDNASVKQISCKLDNVVRNCGTDQDNLLENLAGGNHTFEITVTDHAGNSTSKTLMWSNPSCRLGAINPRLPVNGVEGRDWVLINSVDLQPGSVIQDFTGSTNASARASNDHGDIVITTGDTRTHLSESARILAVESGVVTRVVRGEPSNRFYIGSALNNCSAASNLVEILHSNGFKTIYSHLQKIPSDIVVNSNVSKGQLVGIMGMSGCVDYPRLRFTTLNCNRQKINPIDSRRLDGQIRDNKRDFEYVNVAMHAGNLDVTNYDHWKSIMLEPVPKDTFTRNSYSLVRGFLSGGISTDRLVVRLYNPNGDKVREVFIDHGQVAGRFFSVPSTLLNVRGTWKWRFYQLIRGGQPMQQHEESFTVN